MKCWPAHWRAARVQTGVTSSEIVVDGGRRTDHAVGLDDARGGRGDRRRRHSFGGGPLPQRSAAQPVCRLHGVARHRRPALDPNWRARPWARRSNSGTFRSGRTTPTGSPPSAPRRVGWHREGELAYLQTKFASWAEPIPALLAATDPDDVLHNDLYDRDEARSLVAGADRSGWRRRPRDAPAPGPGRLSGARGRRDSGRFVDQIDDLATAFARFATFRRPRVRALVRESAHDRQDGQPSAVVSERCGQSRDGAGARGAVEPAPGGGGVALGVHVPAAACSRRPNGLRNVEPAGAGR